MLHQPVALVVRNAGSRSREFELPIGDLIRIAEATNMGFYRATRWSTAHKSPLALVARQAVAEAVAAESLRTELPAAAAQLEQKWCSAVRVRAQLRALGPEVEDVALSLMASWRLPLDALPTAAAALVQPASP